MKVSSKENQFLFYAEIFVESLSQDKVDDGGGVPDNDGKMETTSLLKMSFPFGLKPGYLLYSVVFYSGFHFPANLSALGIADDSYANWR